jgi:hypothetical protein
MTPLGTLVARFVDRTARTRAGWLVYRLCGRASTELRRVYRRAQSARAVGNADQDRLDQAVRDLPLVRTLFPDLTVVNGPFRGMRYPAAVSRGSVHAILREGRPTIMKWLVMTARTNNPVPSGAR